MHRMIFLEKDEIGKDNYRRLCNTGVIIFTDYETREISKDSIEYALSEEAIDTREIEKICIRKRNSNCPWIYFI